MFRQSLFRSILFRALGGAAVTALASVYLLALSDSDTWEISAGPLPISNLKVTRRANQAGFATFDLPGFDIPISLENRIFISSPYFRFGGVVYNLSASKSGYRVEAMDFLEALDGNLVYNQDYEGYTDQEILEDLLANNLYVPLSLELETTETPVEIRKVTFDGTSLLEAVERIADLTGKFFYVYQGQWNDNPKLRYLAPSGTYSGIEITPSLLLNDWSWSSSRNTVYTKIRIRTTLEDVPPSNAWIYNETNTQAWGTLISNHYYTTPPPSAWGVGVGKASDYRWGYKIFVPIDRNIQTVKIMAAKVGTPSDLKIKRALPDGSYDSYTLLTASEATTSTQLYSKSVTIPLEYGTNYVELYTETASDSNYWIVGAFDTNALDENLDTARGAKLAGAESVLRGQAVDIWNTSAVEQSYGLSFMLITTGYNTNWTVADGAIANDRYGNLVITKTEADSYSTYDLWLAPELGSTPVSIYRTISPSVSNLDYETLTLKAYYTYNDRPTELRLTLYSSTGSAQITDYINSQETWELELSDDGGWTISGTMDWTDINAIKIETGALILESLYFEGTTETQTALSTAYRRIYDQKIYSDTLTFQHKADMQSYASNLLEKLKRPQRSVSIKARGLYSPQLYSTIKVTLAGESIEGVVVGLEWDLRRGVTTFTLENFPTHKLSSIISQILRGRI